MRNPKVTLRKHYNTIFNYFFRGNNLLKNKLLKDHSNVIHIGEGSVLKSCLFEVLGGGNKIIIGKNCNLNGVRFYMNSENNCIVIGDNVVINASKTQPTFLNACGGKGIIIGKSCLLSNSIEIHTTDYHSVLDEKGRKENTPMDVVIGDHVWIGLQCLILKGTHIANNCIVGARSLLNKPYTEENSMIVGHPARIVKNNTNWKN